LQGKRQLGVLSTLSFMSIPYSSILPTFAALGSFAAAAFAAWIAVGAKKISATSANATVDQAKATATAARTAEVAAQAAVDQARVTAAQAQITDVMAAAAVEQAKVTADAARAADASAATAETLARIELDRRHDEMFPDLSVDYRWETNPRTGQGNLFAYVTSRSRRDYRVSGGVVYEGGGRSDTGPFVLGAGQAHRAYVGDTLTKLPVTLVLEFDSVEPCPCPRGATGNEHWPRSFEIPGLPTQDSESAPPKSAGA
jgi:hypothetical protein